MRPLALLVILALVAATAAADDFETAFRRAVEEQRLPPAGAERLRDLIDRANPHAVPPIEIHNRMCLPCGPTFVEAVFAPIRDDGRVRTYRLLWCFPPTERAPDWRTEAVTKCAFATTPAYADHRVGLGDGVSLEDAFSVLAYVRSQPPVPATASVQMLTDEPRPERLTFEAFGISREGDDLEVGGYGWTCRLHRDGGSWRIVSYRQSIV